MAMQVLLAVSYLGLTLGILRTVGEPAAGPETDRRADGDF